MTGPGVARTIVERVADYEDTIPDQLPSLEDDLASEIFQQLPDAESQLTEPLDFEYLWYDVTVLPDREVIVTP